MEKSLHRGNLKPVTRLCNERRSSAKLRCRCCMSLVIRTESFCVSDSRDTANEVIKDGTWLLRLSSNRGLEGMTLAGMLSAVAFDYYPRCKSKQRHAH